MFDVGEENIGVLPFHDHYRLIEEYVARGLFGNLIVRDLSCEPPDHEVPIFLRKLVGPRRNVAFNSGDLANGQIFSQTFGTTGAFNHFCQHHSMTGTVTVQAAPIESNL